MEENRQDTGDVTTLDEVMSGVSEHGYGGGIQEPKKSRKGLWIGLLLVVIILAAASPFAMAMMKKSALRKNPSSYVLNSLNETDYTKGRVFESSVKLGQGFHSFFENLLLGSSTRVGAGEVVDFIEGFKVKVSATDVNYKATGENPVTSVKYDLLYKDKDVFDTTLRVGEKGLLAEIAGKKILVVFDFKPQSYEKQQKLIDNLKKDKEVREIFEQLFAKSSLTETDAVDPLTGETCDVLNIKISLMDVYQTIKSLVSIMDSNTAVKEFINGVIDQAIEMSNQGGDLDEQQLAMMRSFLQSGMAASMFEQALEESDDEIVAMIEEYDIYFEGDLYVNQKGVVRSDLNFVVGDVRTMFMDIPGFTVVFKSYLSNMPSEGKISESAADLVLEDTRNYIDQEFQAAIETIQNDIIDRLIGSPGFAEMRKFLDKVMNVDEVIESMRMQ